MSFEYRVKYPGRDCVYTIYCRECAGDEHGLCRWCWELADGLTAFRRILLWAALEGRSHRETSLQFDYPDRDRALVGAIKRGDLRLEGP